MQHPELTELIEKAAKEAGSKSELARRIGVAPQRLDDWRTGRRSCPPEKVALIASEGNFHAEQWLARATLWKHEGSEDGTRLKKALGKCLQVTTVAVFLGCGVVADSLAGIPRCIESLNWRRFFSRKIQSTCSRDTTPIGQ